MERQEFSRRDFLRFCGIGFASLALAACGRRVGIRGIEEGGAESQTGKERGPLSDNDLKRLAVISELVGRGEMSIEERYGELSDGARGVFQSWLISEMMRRQSDGFLLIKTNLPKSLEDLVTASGGILDLEHVVTQLREVRIRNANGGYLIYDEMYDTFYKVAAKNSVEGKYLQHSIVNYQEAWRIAGLPDDYVKSIHLIDGLRMSGQEVVVLSLPNVSQIKNVGTLESYIAMLNSQKRVGLVREILLDYYFNVLVPMNMRGVVQQDLNFRNVAIWQINQEGGVILVPIDLNQRPQSFESIRAMLKWQYEQLYDRAGKRAIDLPTFDELMSVQSNVVFENYGISGDKAQQLLEQITTLRTMEGVMEGGNAREVFLPIAIQRDGFKERVLALVDKDVWDNLSQEEKVDWLNKFRQNYIEASRGVRQGELVTVKMPMLGQREVGGEIKIIKANDIGGRVMWYRHRVWEAIRTGWQFVNLALLMWWLSEEIDRFVRPSYTVELTSDRLVDSAIATKKMEVTAILNNVYDNLQGSKEQMVNEFVGDIAYRGDGLVETMLGISKDEIYQLITTGLMTQEELGQFLRECARKAIFPPAFAEVKTGSPVPLIVPGGRVPIDAAFSAFEDEEGRSVVVLWGVDKKDGDNVQEIQPVAVFTKSGEEWRVVFSQSNWLLRITLNQDLSIIMSCNELTSDGQRFQLSCEINDK